MDVVESHTQQLPAEVVVEWSRLPSRVREQLNGRRPCVVFGPPPLPSNDVLFAELKGALALARSEIDVIVIDDDDSDCEGVEGEEGLVLVGMLGTARILPYKLVVTVSGEKDDMVGYVVLGGGPSGTKVSDMLSSPWKTKRKRASRSSPPPPMVEGRTKKNKKSKTLVSTTTATPPPPPSVLPPPPSGPVARSSPCSTSSPSSSSSSSESCSPSRPVFGAYEEEAEDAEDTEAVDVDVGKEEREEDVSSLNRRTTFLLLQLFIHSKASTRWETEPFISRVRDALSGLSEVQVPTQDQMKDLFFSWGRHNPPIERKKMRKINGLQAGVLMWLAHTDGWPTTKEGWKELGAQLQACGVVEGGMKEFSPSYLKKKNRTCEWLTGESVRRAVEFYESVMGSLHQEQEQE